MQFTLAHHRISEVEAVELNLPRAEVVHVLLFALVYLEFVYELVIKRTVRHKLKGTD